MQSTEAIKVHIIHADPVVRAGLHALLLSRASHMPLQLQQPDSPAAGAVVLADHDSGIRLCRQAPAGVRVMIVAPSVKEWEVRTALEAGVLGYLPQSSVPEVLADAMLALSRGRRYLTGCVSRLLADSLSASGLTGRETAVLQLLGKGYCNKTIARELSISLATVKSHVTSVLIKLNATARTHAVVVASQRGLLRDDSGMPGAWPGLGQASSASMRAAAT